MNTHASEAILNADSGEIMGYVTKEPSGWASATIFGHVFSRSLTRSEAEQSVRDNIKSLLQGLWRYFDADDSEWYSCRLAEIYENRVVVHRTDELGFENSNSFKRVI